VYASEEDAIAVAAHLASNVKGSTQQAYDKAVMSETTELTEMKPRNVRYVTTEPGRLLIEEDEATARKRRRDEKTAQDTQYMAFTAMMDDDMGKRERSGTSYNRTSAIFIVQGELVPRSTCVATNPRPALFRGMGACERTSVGGRGGGSDTEDRGCPGVRFPGSGRGLLCRGGVHLNPEHLPREGVFAEGGGPTPLDTPYFTV
jgi:hypothetical protein